MSVTSPDAYLADLNPAQREAVLETEGPLLVIAGAGSGKTRVLTNRVGHLITACGVKPNEILAITFTNKAANEMKERLEDLLGQTARRLWILTFHAACGRILRREAPRLGYRTNFTIYDQADQIRLTKACLEELDRDPKRFVPRGIHAQSRLLQLLAGGHRNLFAVGDPDQSIYAFRGADIRNILEFERDFPGTRTIPLEQNYRSTNTILRAANHVIANNRERKPKNLFSELGEGDPVRVYEVEDEHAEARFVAAEIAGLVEEGYNGDEIAVFYRTNAQSRVLEDVLVRQGIAYHVVGGPRYYERAEIKALIAYLQVIDNPDAAVSLQRIVNRPRRGIGASSMARLQPYADAQGMSLFEALEHAEEAGITGAPLRAVQGFHTLHQSLQ